MNENIDLTEILKDVPAGEIFWHKSFGRVMFLGFSDSDYPVTIYALSNTYKHNRFYLSREGKDYVWSEGECLLVPSRDQQDWSKYIPPKRDLPLNTPCMVALLDLVGGWCLRRYAGEGRCFNGGRSNGETSSWGHIVPCEKFNFEEFSFCKEYDYGRKI